MKTVFYLYDSRYWNSEEDAVVIDTAETEDDCRAVPCENGEIWVQYDEANGKATNPRPRPDLSN